MAPSMIKTLVRFYLTSAFILSVTVFAQDGSDASGGTAMRLDKLASANASVSFSYALGARDPFLDTRATCPSATDSKAN